MTLPPPLTTTTTTSPRRSPCAAVVLRARAPVLASAPPCLLLPRRSLNTLSPNAYPAAPPSSLEPSRSPNALAMSGRPRTTNPDLCSVPPPCLPSIVFSRVPSLVWFPLRVFSNGHVPLPLQSCLFERYRLPGAPCPRRLSSSVTTRRSLLLRPFERRCFPAALASPMLAGRPHRVIASPYARRRPHQSSTARHSARLDVASSKARQSPSVCPRVLDRSPRRRR